MIVVGVTFWAKPRVQITNYRPNAARMEAPCGSFNFSSASLAIVLSETQNQNASKRAYLPG